MTIDWQRIARRLAQPWWGPHNPSYYTYRRADNSLVGVGMLVGQQYGAWNLTLLERGNFSNPTDFDGQRLLFVQFQRAKELDKLQVQGQDLGSYTMLLDPRQFRWWLTKLEPHHIDIKNKEYLIKKSAALVTYIGKEL